MFQSKDGRKSGSKFVARKRDEMSTASQGMGDEQKTEMQAGKPAEQADVEPRDTQENQEQTAENPREVVKAHGPAHSVHVHHNHSNKQHKVISHHADGHMHESDHPTPEAAHDHASQLGAGEPQGEGAPDGASLMGDATPAPMGNLG